MAPPQEDFLFKLASVVKSSAPRKRNMLQYYSYGNLQDSRNLQQFSDIQEFQKAMGDTSRRY